MEWRDAFLRRSFDRVTVQDLTEVPTSLVSGCTKNKWRFLLRVWCVTAKKPSFLVDNRSNCQVRHQKMPRSEWNPILLLNIVVKLFIISFAFSVNVINCNLSLFVIATLPLGRAIAGRKSISWVPPHVDVTEAAIYKFITCESGSCFISPPTYRVLLI